MEKKSKIEYSITAVLIFVLIFAVTKAVGRKGQAKRLRNSPTPEKLSQAEEPKGKDKELFRRLEEETKNLKLKRDPFVLSPITSITTTPSGLHLSGIVWAKENPKAIINDIIVGIGDKIGGNTIIDIEQDKVTLTDDTNYFELRLGQ